MPVSSDFDIEEEFEFEGRGGVSTDDEVDGADEVVDFVVSVMKVEGCGVTWVIVVAGEVSDVVEGAIGAEDEEAG
jgi:hypothetical protein